MGRVSSTKQWLRTVVALAGVSACSIFACSEPHKFVDPEVGTSGTSDTAGANAHGGSERGGSANGGGSATAGAGASDTGGTCKPTETKACYESPEGKSYGPTPATAVGTCTIGQRTCATDGTWGPCVGAVAALAADTCEPGNDANCDGKANDGCSCANGEKRDCGIDEGDCVKGTQTCANAVWGDCVGEVKPEAADTCDDGNDANCNGSANNGCECINGETQDCGDATGNCEKGKQTCKNGVWGACTGGVAKQTADKCSPAGDDANCNGVPNEGCDCAAGQTRPCAKCGVQTCDANFKWSSTCSNQKECEPNDIKTDAVSCGNCGSQSRKATCNAQCGWGAWADVGTCLGSGPCKPGTTADLTQNVACGNCGTGTLKQAKKCTAQCDWPANWTDAGTCTGATGCTPGTAIAAASVTCNYCGEQKREQVCNASCQYGVAQNKGACLAETQNCANMPGDERAGYVACFWDGNGSPICPPSQQCCYVQNVGQSCTANACAGGTVSPCDGPEDCPNGKKCCAQFTTDGSENSYATCEPACAARQRCHADRDCDAGQHCSVVITASYHTGLCGSNP